MVSIEGQKTLVTGGTRGIGLAVARALAQKGAGVFICGRNQSGVDQAMTALKRERKDDLAGTVCDVRQYDQVQRMFRDVKALWGRLDILINNAGVRSHGNVEELDPLEWRSTIDTNLSGVFYCCHEALPLLKQAGGGFIINIGSLAGKHAHAGSSAYSASKFGLIGFSESLMQEVRYDGIRVSCILPGSVNTTFGSRSSDDSDATWRLLPEDVAGTAISLIEMDPRALPSLVELRPTKPEK